MCRLLLRSCLCCLLIVPAASFAAPAFTPPTPEELKMTSDPAAPGAPAVYLFLEQTADDQIGQHTFYARIKILTDAGREQFSDVTIPYEDKEEKIRNIEARTIHSDGAIIPFTGKPWQKEVVKGGGLRYMEKGFSMPDVQVGSILEYRYQTTYEDWWAPHWYVQQSIFVHRAHYSFKAGMNSHIASIRLLPTTAQITEKNGDWDLVMNEIPAAEEEDDAPPAHAVSQRVLFYYVYPNIDSVDKYWDQEGRIWSNVVDQFIAAGKLKDAVAQIVAPGDTDDQKLRKIYAAVMKLENTSFTRERTQQENKRLKLKIRNAADIWQQQRGNDDEIALLFVGLARAAGLKAYAMIVTNRDRNIFIRGELNWGQLDDIIAIVNVNGVDNFFDPGERYCEYGKLRWIHAGTSGVRQTDKGTETAQTPPPIYKENSISRTASLRLDPDSAVTGNLRIVMSGAAALRWRQEALLTDEQAAKKTFEDELQKSVPDGVDVKLNHFVGLTDPDERLMAVVDVTGHLGTRTGKRLFLPTEFFETRAKSRFASEKRESPIDLHYPFVVMDDIVVNLPAGLAVESLPSNAEIPLAHLADYTAHYQSANGVFEQARVMAVGSTYFKVDEYPQVRNFFQKTGAQDQVQLALTAAPASAAVPAASASK